MEFLLAVIFFFVGWFAGKHYSSNVVSATTTTEPPKRVYTKEEINAAIEYLKSKEQAVVDSIPRDASAIYGAIKAKVVKKKV